MQSKELGSTRWTKVERDTERCCALYFVMDLPLNGLIVPLESMRGLGQNSGKSSFDGLLYTDPLGLDRGEALYLAGTSS